MNMNKNEEFFKFYDLTTQEGYINFNKKLDELESKDLSLLELFGIDHKELIKSLREIGTNEYLKNIHNKQECVKENNNENNNNKNNNEVNITRPSDLLDVDKKLQIHNIVGEYMETVIKPANNYEIPLDVLNDMYAGLFEFACWVMNK